MNSADTEGLGLSVALFMGAILAVLAVLAVPVWLAVRPQVFENPVLAKNDPLLNGPIVGVRPTGTFPLAVLQHNPIVDPKVVAALNAKVVAKDEKPEHRPVQRTAQRHIGTPVAELQPERPHRSGLFPFQFVWRLGPSSAHSAVPN